MNPPHASSSGLEIPDDAICQMHVDSVLRSRTQQAPRGAFLSIVENGPRVVGAAVPTPAELYPHAAGDFFPDKTKWIAHSNTARWLAFLTPYRVAVPKCETLPEHAFLLLAKTTFDAMNETFNRVINAFVVVIPDPLEFVCDYYGFTIVIVQKGPEFYACVSGTRRAITKKEAEEVWGS